MLRHRGNFGHNRFLRPLDPEHLGQLLQILSRSLADAKHCIAQPAHAQTTEFLVEEFHAQLTRQQRHVLYNGQPDTPLFIFRQLHDSGKQALREQFDADDIVHLLKLGDDVQTHIGEVVLEHLQEHGE